MAPFVKIEEASVGEPTQESYEVPSSPRFRRRSQHLFLHGSAFLFLKALLSITRAADVGYECNVNAKGSYLLDTWSGEKVPIARKGNLYVMRAWAKYDPTWRDAHWHEA